MKQNIIQCCISGKKHESSVCQDNCFKIEDSDLKVMALCDGTSDAEYSDLGSKWVANFSVNYLKENFDRLYNTCFSTSCDALIDYHQNLLWFLSEQAYNAKGTNIVVDRQINRQELMKFCTTIQAVAIKKNKGVFFKVGNGSAIILNENRAKVFSDSSTDSPTKHVTLPNTLSVLKSCEFKSFELDKKDFAIILLTDGVEYPNGIFYNHEIRPGFSDLESLVFKETFSENDLRNYICDLKDSPYNLQKDDIGISVLFISDRQIQKPTDSAPDKSPRDTSSASSPSQNDMAFLNDKADQEESITPELESNQNDNNNLSELTDDKTDDSQTDELASGQPHNDKTSLNNKFEHRESIDPELEPNRNDDITPPKLAGNKTNNSPMGITSTLDHPHSNKPPGDYEITHLKAVFCKKTIYGLLFACILGLLLGCLSVEINTAKKILSLNSKIDSLTKDIESMNKQISDVKEALLYSDESTSETEKTTVDGENDKSTIDDQNTDVN